MHSSFARASWRAAGLVARKSGRACSSSAVPNHPVVKHSHVPSVTAAASVSTSHALKASNATPADADHSVHAAASTVATLDASAPVREDIPTLAHEDGHAVPPPSSSSSPASLVSAMSHSESDDPSDDVFVPSTRSRRSVSTATSPDELLAELRGLTHRNAVRSALFHFIAALKVDQAPAVDDQVIKFILPMLGRYGWAPSSLDAINLALDREYNLSIGIYNCALHAMSRSGDFATLHSTIERMWTLPEDSRPNATSYNYLIGSCMYRGAVDRAFDVLHDMKKHMIYPTFATYHALITGCLRSNDPRRAYTTLTAVERQRFEVGAMTISQVLVACADADLVDEAMQLLPRLDDAMPQYIQEVHRIAEKRHAYRLSSTPRTSYAERAIVRGNAKLELGAISELLHAAFRNCRSDLGLAAWSLLRKHYPDVAISPTLWYCLIGSLAGAGEFEKAFEVVGMMREKGISIRLKDLEHALIKPLSIEISNIDDQYFRLCDRLKGDSATDSKDETAAKENIDGAVSEDMTDVDASAVSEDVTVASEDVAAVSEDVAAVDAAAVSDDVTAVSDDVAAVSDDVAAVSDDVQVLSEDVAVVPENIAAVFKEVVSGSDQIISEQPVDEAEDEVEGDVGSSLRDILAEKANLSAMANEWLEMKPKGVGIEELNCIIAACSVAGDLDRAFQTYDEVEKTFGLEKTVDTFNALLEGCIQVKHVRGGMRVLSEMESLGHTVSGETVQMAVRLMTRGGRASECVEFLKKVKEDGGKIPLQSYLLLTRYYVRGDAMDKATAVFHMGVEDGFDGRVLKGRIDLDGVRKLDKALGINTDRDDRENSFHDGGGRENTFDRNGGRESTFRKNIGRENTFGEDGGSSVAESVTDEGTVGETDGLNSEAVGDAFGDVPKQT